MKPQAFQPQGVSKGAAEIQLEILESLGVKNYSRLLLTLKRKIYGKCRLN